MIQITIKFIFDFTPISPELIEGNHNWCKLLWQLPLKQGLKEMLGKYQ